MTEMRVSVKWVKNKRGIDKRKGYRGRQNSLSKPTLISRYISLTIRIYHFYQYNLNPISILCSLIHHQKLLFTIKSSYILPQMPVRTDILYSMWNEIERGWQGEREWHAVIGKCEEFGVDGRNVLMGRVVGRASECTV